MKKTHNQPTIELVEVAIEQGIAMSTESATFGLRNAAYEDVDW